MPDDGTTTRIQLIKLQHADPALIKLFELAKADNREMSSLFSEIRNDVLVRRAPDRISPVGLEVTHIVVPSAL